MSTPTANSLEVSAQPRSHPVFPENRLPTWQVWVLAAMFVPHDPTPTPNHSWLDLGRLLDPGWVSENLLQVSGLRMYMLASSCDWNLGPSKTSSGGDGHPPLHGQRSRESTPAEKEESGGRGRRWGREEGVGGERGGEGERERARNFPGSSLRLFPSPCSLLVLGFWKKFRCPYNNFCH